MPSQIRFLLLGVVFAFLGCDSEDDTFDKTGTYTDERTGVTYNTVILNGQEWFAEDLNIEGRESHTFNQALTACPNGWRIASQQDWEDLLLSMGGYLKGSDSIGQEPSTTTELLQDPNGLNLSLDEYYWTADPAWVNIFTIRSMSVVITEWLIEDERAVLPALVSNLNTSSFKCRCIRSEADNGNYFRLKIDGESKNYEAGVMASRYQHGLEQYDAIGITGFENLTASLINDQLTLIINEEKLKDLTIPGETSAFFFDLRTSKELFDQQSSQSPDSLTLRLQINTYSNDVVAGRISGHILFPDLTSIDGEFLISLE